MEGLHPPVACGDVPGAACVPGRHRPVALASYPTWTGKHLLGSCFRPEGSLKCSYQTPRIRHPQLLLIQMYNIHLVAVQVQHTLLDGSPVAVYPPELYLVWLKQTFLRGKATPSLRGVQQMNNARLFYEPYVCLICNACHCGGPM